MIYDLIIKVDNQNLLTLPFKLIMHFKHIYTQDTLSKEYLFVREKSIIISLVIHHCFKQKKKFFVELYIFHLCFAQNRTPLTKLSLWHFCIGLLVAFSSAFSITLENPVSNCLLHTHKSSFPSACSLVICSF